MERDCRTARNCEKDGDIPTRSRATLPSSSSLASRSTSRLHLCLHLSLSPPLPSTFTDAASSTLARYADVSLQPIEIFIPTRLPFQFMLRTSEMHCHRRATGFPPRYLPPPLPRYTNNWKVSTSFLFLHPRRNSLVFSPSREGKIRKEREARSRMPGDNRRDRANVDIPESTYTLYLSTCVYFTLRRCVHYTSDRTETQLLCAAINSNSFFFFS